MKYSDLLENVSVLFLEEDPIQRELFERWISNVSTKTAAGPQELFQQFDPSVAVAFLSQGCLGTDEETVRKFILTRNPSCQLVLITSSTLDDVRYEAHYDTTLTRPTSREILQSTVQKRVRYSIYSSLVEEYYALNTRLVALERTDSEDNAEMIPKIETRIEQLEVLINHIKSTISHEDVTQILNSVGLHREQLRYPSKKTEVSTVSKYHPDACPNCSLQWGVDHGNKLGYGFSQIGANVWKCTDCSYVVRGSDGSNRYIT